MKVDRKKLEYACGAIVVALAFCIMLPGIFQYLAGLSRVFVWVSVIILLATVIAFISRKVAK